MTSIWLKKYFHVKGGTVSTGKQNTFNDIPKMFYQVLQQCHSQHGIKRYHRNVENGEKENWVLTAWPDHQDHWVLPCQFTEQRPRPHGCLSRARHGTELTAELPWRIHTSSRTFRKPFPPAHFFLPLVGLGEFRIWAEEVCRGSVPVLWMWAQLESSLPTGRRFIGQADMVEWNVCPRPGHEFGSLPPRNWFHLSQDTIRWEWHFVIIALGHQKPGGECLWDIFPRWEHQGTLWMWTGRGRECVLGTPWTDRLPAGHWTWGCGYVNNDT